MHTLMEAMVCIKAPWSQPADSSTGWALLRVTLTFPGQPWGKRDNHALLTPATQEGASILREDSGQNEDPVSFKLLKPQNHKSPVRGPRACL